MPGASSSTLGVRHTPSIYYRMIIILLAAGTVNIIFSLHSIQYLGNAPPTLGNAPPAEFIASKRPLCQDTKHLFHNMTTLTSAYTQAEKFHNGGGNLKVIETYLNRQVDKTYKMLGITFTPEAAANSESPRSLGPNEPISGKVLELMKRKDVHKRGGYDQRQFPGQFLTQNTNYYNTRGMRARSRLDVIEPFHTDRWVAGLGPTFDVCKSVEKIGGRAKPHYEDKFMCSFGEFSAPTEKHEQKKCNMISIGSNGEWGFEQTVAKMTNCATHTFDCTVQDPRKPNVDSIHFYPHCVSATNKMIDGREYLTYSELLEKTGMTDPPALFKMDVEGFEFDVMVQMLEDAWSMNKTHLLPAQISLELHYATRMYDVAWMQRYLQASEIAMFMGVMYRRGGYLPVKVKLFPFCYPCAEVLFVRAFCVQ